MENKSWIKGVLVAIAAVCVAVSGVAKTNQGTRLVSGYVNLNDSANVYKALYENTPIEPEFKLAPKFAIVGAENKFVFSLGASMKFTTSFDWGNPVRSPMGMGPSDIQLVPTDDRHLYQMSAGGSGIFFNVIGFPNTANEIGLFISVGVDNEANNTYKLSAGQVYMRYRNFQCGYATSLYNDRGADAFTIDAHGPCASGAHNTVGMNWQHYFNRHMRLGVGVELPKASYTQINPPGFDGFEGNIIYSMTSHQYIPNFPIYLGYNWDSGHVRLSTIVRNIHYIDLLTGESHNQVGNAIKLTGKATAGAFNFFWMGQMGWASASCLLDNSGEGLDLVPDESRPGLLKPTKSWGCIGAAQWNITPKIFATAQYSYMRNYTPHYSHDATTEYVDQMRHGYTVTANAVWKFSSIFSAGIEYRYASRTNEDHTHLANNRVYGMLLMNF